MSAIITTVMVGIGVAWMVWYIISAPITTVIEIIKELVKSHRLSFTSLVVLLMETLLSALVIISAINIMVSLAQTLH